MAMEKAPSHSGVFLNVPLKRGVSRLHILVGASWQVTSLNMIWWAGESACTVFVVHEALTSVRSFPAAAGPRLSCIHCQLLSQKGQKYSINN